MLDTKNPLVSEFLKDHQQFSRLLYETSKLLEANKLDQARQRAKELNSVAGAHIAYEEAELYPRLAGFSGQAATEQILVDEHREVLDSLKKLLDESALDQEQLESIKAAFQAALQHAEHCGTLISLLTQLDDAEQAESLSELRRFREQAKNWTDL